MARFFALLSSSSPLPRFSVYSLVVIFFVFVASEKSCDPTACPGPLQYYKDLGCKPVYENEGDCCAIRYDCDALKSLDPNKCYVNGHEYEIGESLKDEDANPCDLGCTCRKYSEIASFHCAVVDCFGPHPGCYFKASPDQCCHGPEVCPDKDEEIPTCEVDGKIYKDGQHFTPKSNPDLSCYCKEGYKGENVEPFCMKLKRPYCAPIFHDPSALHGNCSPVYYPSQSPKNSCSVFSRCQNSKDVAIHKHEENHSKSLENDNMKCVFGNMTLHIGDELNQNTDYSSVCVKCVCEVPPYLTCQRLPYDQCDTNGPRFEPYIPKE